MSDAEAQARFAALLREYRTAQGLSQNALARASQVDPGYICRLEKRSQGGLPTRKILKRMAVALALNPADTDRFLHAGGAATETDWQAAYERLLGTGEEIDAG